MADATDASPHELTRRVDAFVARLPWVVIATGFVANLVSESSTQRTSPTVLLVTLSVFFLLLMARLALAVRLNPGRRPALVLLLAAIIAWSAGSASVNAGSLEAQTHFPAPGEWLFMLSYLGMAGFLMLDVDRRTSRPTRAWLDVAVILGGTSCLASLLLVTPVRLASGQDGLPLLLALMYPLADVALAVAVLGQALLQSRTDLHKSLMLGAGFVLLACADSAFALQSSARTYDFDILSNALWGAGFVLLVTAACRPRERVLRSMPRMGGGGLMICAGLVALAVLTVRPDEALTPYTIPPAVLTMMAVSARMVLALRDANRATEAFALSQTDDLTKLPNRRAVRARLKAALESRQPLALMLLDLDGFKEINDALGHHVGDVVLKFVAVRMRDAVDSDVMVARLGGDEFAILVGTDDEIELLETARHVLAELNRPIEADSIEVSPSGSIGISVVQPDDADGDEVLRRADVAMYQAKSHRSGAALYDPQVDDFSRVRLQLAEELRRSIKDGQIEVWYQPQVEATTMRVSGLEALVRWRHPTQGLLSPVTFLPAARRAGFMGALSEAIAWQATRDLRRLLDAGLDVRVAINCAPPELLSHTFLPRLYASLAEWRVPPDRLVLEVTEDSFLADPARAREILLELRDHGIHVSIDDYGTGFSSLAYLRDLPVQELKIDRSLVSGVSTDERSRMIVSSTVQLAHALDMRAVAEGVEDAADLSQLEALGIDTLQGFHLARPMAAADVEQWIREWSSTATLFRPAAVRGRQSRENEPHPLRPRRVGRVLDPHRHLLDRDEDSGTAD